jgi:tripartite-type tricarboxylate transporter receptor subunit TctC
LAGELLASMTKAPLTAVPYRGSAPAVSDVLGGQLSTAMVDLTSAAAHVKAGKVLALAVTSPTRIKIAPEIPTIAESGVPGYSAPAWMGMFAPAKTPAVITNRLAKEIHAVLSSQDAQQEIMAMAAEPAYMGPDEFAAFIADESKKWNGVIRSTTLSTK